MLISGVAVSLEKEHQSDMVHLDIHLFYVYITLIYLLSLSSGLGFYFIFLGTGRTIGRCGVGAFGDLQ